MYAETALYQASNYGLLRATSIVPSHSAGPEGFDPGRLGLMLPVNMLLERALDAGLTSMSSYDLGCRR